MDAKWQKRAGYLKKGENWLIPGFCCLILFLAAGLAWDYYYDLNDDVLIRDILSGVYTGEPEALTAQLLWPLGALLAGLYRLLPGLPVFGAFLWLCQAGSVFLILRRSLLWLEARADGETPALSGQDGAGCPPCPVWKKLLLCFLETLTAAVCLLYHLVFVQYTVTAGLLAAAAVFYFLTVPRNLAVSGNLTVPRNPAVSGNPAAPRNPAVPGKEESAVSFWLRCLPAALLFWLAFCLRSEMGLLLLPLAGVAGIWKWSDCRPVFTKKKIAAFAGFFGWIAAGLLVCLGADRLACSDPGWRAFERLFDARTEVYDFYDAGLRSWEDNRDFYEALGLSQEQCELLSNYNFGADDAIDASVMEQAAAYGRNTQGAFAHSLSEGVWLYAQRLRNNRAIVPDDQLPWLLPEAGLAALLLAAAAGEWIGRLRRRKGGVGQTGTSDAAAGSRGGGSCRRTGILWKLLLLGAVRSGLWMYLILRERVPERISHPLYFCELILLGWLLLDAMAGGFRAGAGSPLAGMESPRAGAGSPQAVTESPLAGAGSPLAGEERPRAVTSAAAGRPSAVLPTENGRLSRALPAAAALFCLAAGICFLPGQAERTREESLRRQQGNAVNLAALSYYEEHGELLYLADVMSTVDFSEKLFSEKSRPGNYDLLGGWLCKSPHSEKKLAAFGYESMGQAVSEGKNVRFVGEPETDWSWLTGLLAEQGRSAVLTPEEEITAEGRSLYIWRLEGDG